mmetsp:Transcript_11771/g.14223  ORF Transcript_11771/g.14223 Transcript_11771/m.14223 type:complete len:441 (+) Transcript_11771:89-1411(+)|eukprot:CAMPEP_0114344188 /NCGR_PEP_ID=MMETSP0101-20121206/11225_1 /TAXON_ID=38822 ORGANISM="Pteridomonas danica, Strain PT" /NCGR_SAMPLE_ID=MMETSP0101 /ASSEMBLY_ACC=CAM_ASM_000211 /LENGTH=440 /DNA_ID=CAMNT_0001479397 /DNA_START=64 /DNA_END=1386 /DNA_ORIENTATION=-
MNNIQKKDDDIYDEEFDGVATDEERNARKMMNENVGFGLPLDLEEISPSPTDEFESNGKATTRTITAIDFHSKEQSSPIEFDIGASFVPNQSMFASSPAPSGFEDSQQILKQKEVPLMPFYLKPSKTSFQSSKKTIHNLISDLELVFSKNSVCFSTEPQNSPYIYDCSMFCLMSLIEFEVKIFALQQDESRSESSSNQNFLIEFRHLSGCYYGFSESYSVLSKSFLPSKTPFVAMKPAPLFLDVQNDELSMPSLERSSSSSCSSPCSIIDHLSLEETCDIEMKTQSVRACLMTLNNEEEDVFVDKVFCDDGIGIPLANQLTKMAQSSSNTDDDGLKTVIFGSIAKLTTLENISMNWLNHTVNTVIEHGLNDDNQNPHVRREALRCVEVMAQKNRSLAAKFVRYGVVPLLEIEASGDSDPLQSPDLPAQEIAQKALLACRA